MNVHEIFDHESVFGQQLKKPDLTQQYPLILLTSYEDEIDMLWNQMHG